MVKKSLSDELAVERTKLAEERTYLAYIRTGFNLVLAGLFFVGYFQTNTAYVWIGYLTVLIGVVFVTYGFYYHEKTKAILNKLIGGLRIFKKKSR
jgi:putative membrane protein